MSSKVDATITIAKETPFAEGITNKVEQTVPSSVETRTEGKVKFSQESMERELAEAKAENAKLRADLEKERSEKKLLGNRQDDPFAPREGKTLLWTDVNMTLVRNKVCFLKIPLAPDTSLTMHLFIS
jgi:hypothetical protein